MLQRWLLRRGKDFSDLPDCQGLDEKKSSLIVARAKQQNFLRVEAERFGAQGRFDLFQSSFLSLRHFCLENNFYDYWDTN